MPPGANEAGRLEFVRAQLELTRRYAGEIEQGDYRGAEVVGRHLTRGALELSRLLADFDNETDYETMKEISSALGEMKQIQDRLLGWLEPTRDRLGELLLELQRGRALVSGYRPGRILKSKMVEVSV